MTKMPVKQVKLPVIYEDALRDLVACQTLDEAKYFSDKAEALAAWAKIYKSDQAAVEARRLKLHAYRRMGQIAAELRPSHRIPNKHGGMQWADGPTSLLRESGLSGGTADLVSRISKADQNDFNVAVNLPRPPSPTGFYRKMSTGSEGWKKCFGVGGSLGSTRGWIRANDPKELARSLSSDEATKARALVRPIQDWLDEFEQYLPKGDA